VTVPAELETQWIAGARQGDRRAFGNLVDFYRERVINVVYRMLGDPDLAEDVAQEAFLKGWCGINRYDPGYPFRSWIYRIAINAALDACRREASHNKKAITEGDPKDPASPDGSPEAAFESQERAQLVRKAILDLPEASRAALVLREYEGLSYTEISAALGVPIGTVKSRLSYARSLLRDTLGRLLEGS
jgi:RNA polymerase sigma-70 factor (ECF subfamily)